MRTRSPLMLAAVFSTLALPATAFAQAVAPIVAPSPATALTPYVMVISLLTLISGFIGQAINTGGILGIVTTPKPWLPVLTLTGGFLSAFIVSLTTSGALSMTTLWNAVIGGAFALLTGAGGAAAHAHLNAHKGPLTGPGIGSAPRTPQPARDAVAAAAASLSPPALKFSWRTALVGTAAVGPVLGALVACNQPILPVLDRIANVVSADLAAGDTDAQIASDVCKTLGGSALTDEVCANAETIIQDVVVSLLATKQLQGVALDRAQAYSLKHAAAASSCGGK